MIHDNHNPRQNRPETSLAKDDFKELANYETSDFELTERDIELAYKECVLQHATSETQIKGMREALAYTKLIAYSGEELTPEDVTEFIHILYEMIEPGNGRGWRTTPVTFKNGNMGEDPANLPRVMAIWSEAFAEASLEPDLAYYYFEKNHPRNDGNGRAGFCLWAFDTKRQTGQWPETLPPDLFGEGRTTQMTFQTNFGNVEDPHYFIKN